MASSGSAKSAARRCGCWRRSAQGCNITRVATPISHIANPQAAFRNVAVQFTSGKALGRVVAIATNGAGRATRVRVALDDMPAQQIWLDQDDLVYSRSHDVIVAHDVHAPAMAVADAR